MAQTLARLGRALKKNGEPYRYKKGHIPANKGLRRPGWSPGRMKETQFKKGHRPHTWKPLGTTRWMSGYLQRKMTDTGYPPRDWQPVHRLLWEEVNGPVPAGLCLRFKDGNRENIRLDNLELIARAENMARNTIQRYPTELKQAIRAAGKLRRKIKEKADGKK